ALLAVGFSLDEIPNDITRVTPASFEPSLDYVVVKIPRWNFEKFKGVDRVLGPQMKAVGEVMAIGRTFPEALQKGIRALDIGMLGFGYKRDEQTDPDALKVPTAQRLFQTASALFNGVSMEEVSRTTGFDPWFVRQMAGIIAIQHTIIRKGLTLDRLDQKDFWKLKRAGYSDAHIAQLIGV
ncbi:MAG: carbamoyl phosphate synthase large subunit, partial [Anaerolineae bacterium]|nr:carbamoyl phosphate synthase large subunit [Anaerolineae bacterium]